MASLYNRSTIYRQLNRPSTIMGMTDKTVVLCIIVFLASIMLTKSSNLLTLLALAFDGLVLCGAVVISQSYDVFFVDKFLTHLKTFSFYTQAMNVRATKSRLVTSLYDTEYFMAKSNWFFWVFREALVWLKRKYIYRENTCYSLPIEFITDKLIRNKDGSYSALLKLEGLDLCSMTPLKSNQRYKTVLTMLNNSIFEHVVLSIYSKRSLIKPEALAAMKLEAEAWYARALNQVWKGSFKFDTKNEHYVLLTTDKSVRSKMLAESPEALIAGAIKLVTQTLLDLKIKLCTADEVSDFVSNLFYFRTINNLLYDPYNGDDLVIEREHIYAPACSSPYVGYLTLKNYSKELDDQLVHLLLTLNLDLTFIQHFHKISDEKSKTSIGRRLNRLSAAKNKNAIVLELKAALESLNAGEITMYESRQAIQIRAESLEKLAEMKLQIRNLIERDGHNASLISMNTGALYASMWPSQRFFNDQLNVITSENAANFITFTTMTTGRTKNAWGEEPVNYFSTSYSNLYGFNFQITSENRAPGHTLIIGSTGSGKTVLANFLIASALKYPGIKVRSFDSLLGLYVFTQLNEGIYQSFDGTCGLNPCNLDFAERPENISKAALFLQSFLTTMAGSVTELESAKIAEEINIFMQADKSDHEYTLEGLMVRFEGNTADRVKLGLSKKLLKYAPNTPEGNYFYPATNKQKLLSFSSQLCTFDFKDILATNNTTLIGLITSYIIYKLYVDESPMLIFIDELPAYIKSPIFREMAAKLLAEGRKLNKVLMAAVQNIDQITNTPEGTSSLIGNFKHFLIYPIPNMSESDKLFLRNDLGLSERDIYWLAQSSGNKREVMSVEVEGEQGRSSVRVSVDLAPLGPLLKGLLSDNSEVQRLRECELAYQDSAQVRKAFLGLDF